MARKRKPTSPAVATISISPSDPAFGDTISVTAVVDDPAPWAHLTISRVGDGVLLQAWVDLFRGNNEFVLGPTPSWSGGTGNGSIVLEHIEGGVTTVLSEPFLFSVRP